MTPERWTRINELFEHAIELEEPEAKAWLMEQCRGDSDLLQEVEKLVRNHRAAGDYLETPATPLSLHEFTQPEVGAAVTSTRFEIRRFLGRGGFGDVYAALDRERQVLVAVKHFRERGAGSSAGLIRFKDEFRRVAKRSAELNHRNLVRLYELVQEDSNWFLTMELLDGCDLGDAIQGWQKAGRANPSPQLVAEQARLLLDLADGLEALHSAGILHRDIKPSNVWVTADGCLKLLDFGIAKELAEFKRGVSSLGTPDFVAPEQIVGKTCPASDWYSVGVILYQILTGRLPFDGEDVQVMARKQDSDPPLPSSFVHAVPADLELLCMGLLRRDPTARFGAAEIREALAGRACPSPKRETGKLDSRPTDSSRSSGIFRLASKDSEDALVGRGSELTQMRLGLDLAREGKPCCLHVIGESGMGKSALIQQFLVLALAEDSDAVVLRGRCYETEVIAYKAFDELLDDLARFLQNLTPENRAAILPRHVQALARVFPVFKSPVFQSLTQLQRKAAEARDPSDPVATRREAFRSLRELLARVADRHRLILFMDDLQWGDTDSLAIFREILSGPDAPALLLILAYRAEDADRTRLLREIEKEEKQWTATVMRVPVTALSQKHSVELAQRVLPSSGAPDGLAPSRRSTPPDSAAPSRRSTPPDSAAPQWRSAAERIAAESEGNPFLIREFANFVGESADASQAETTITTLSLAVVLERQLRRMDAPVARALEVMSVAGGPLDEKIVYAAAEFGADLLAARSAMLSTRLARAATAAKASFGTAFDTAINLAINPAFRTAFNLDLYHARVRSALLSQLPPERKHEIHLAIAQALEESGAADYERMLVHFRGAGDREKVALYARSAADRAAKLLAFEHAARLYREALEVARERPDPQSTSTVGELWQLLAGALAHAGRGREAAEAYFAAAAAGPSGSGSRPDESESLRLQIRGTEQLLISGHNAEGLSRLGEILPRIGVPCPTSRWRIEASITWNRMRTRIGMRRGIGRNRTGQEHELQMDACWSGALGVAMVDPRRSAEFCARHLAWALESDDPNRISAALAAEAVHSLGDRWRAADPDTLLTEARRTSISVPGRQSEAFVACMSAIVAGLRGRWRDSLNFARRVLTRGRESSDSNVKPVRESGSVLRLEGATGTGSGLRLGGAGWERDTAVIFSLIAKVMLGEWTSAARTLTEMTNEARDRGNRYGLVNFRLLTAGYVTRLAADQPEQALQEVRELIAMWDSPAPSRRSSPDSPRFDLQRYFATVWEADVALYSGKGEEAWAVNEAAWPLVRRSDLLRLQILRISAAFVRGKCAVAAAAADSAGSARRAAMLRQAGKARDMLAREDTGLAIALAALLSACIAATSQQYDRMAADLANAESLLTQAEMIPWAAAVRYRRAQWDPAMEPASGESDWMRDQRIVNPQRLVNFLMPGDWSK